MSNAPTDLDALVARHLETLRNYVRLSAGPALRRRETVDDLVQSTLREVLEARDGLHFENDAAFRSFLYTVAAHKIISKSRHHQAEKRAAEREEQRSGSAWDPPQPGASRPSRSPSRHAERADDLERLARAFDALPEADRQLLAMRKVFDLTTRDIASQLGLPESTVRWRLAQILAEVAARMGA